MAIVVAQSCYFRIAFIHVKFFLIFASLLESTHPMNPSSVSAFSAAVLKYQTKFS